MSANYLLAQFERIIEGPASILQLRHCILDLAIRGKLARQNPSDQPAIELLQQIAKDQHRAPNGRRNGKAKESSGEFAGAFTIPVSWKWIRFGRIHDLVRGVSYSQSDVSVVPDSDHLPILRANNIGTSLNFDEIVYVDKACISDEQMLRRGDYLIALSSGSKSLVGKAALLDKEYRGAFGAFCGAVRLREAALGPFVGVYLASRLYRDAIAAGSRGIGINNLKKQTISDLPFPLPPLAEQRRIVIKVNELMALCDQLEASQAKRETTRDGLTRAVLTHLNSPEADPANFADRARTALKAFNVLTTRPDQVVHLRETILNLAVRGKLVAHDPNDGSASDLLKKIVAERTRLTKQGRIKRTDLDPTVDDATFSCPRHWVWTRLGAVGEWGSGSTPSRSRLDFYGGGFTWLKSGELNDDQNLTGSDEKITKLALESCSFRQNRTGDVLIAMYGATIGKLAILAEDAVTNQAVCGCSPFTGVLNRFLFLFLRSQREQFRAASEGGAQPNISKIKILRTPFPLPPLAEQHRIVARVNELMTLCARLEANLAASNDIRRQLLSSLIVNALAVSDEAVA